MGCDLYVKSSHISDLQVNSVYAGHGNRLWQRIHRLWGGGRDARQATTVLCRGSNQTSPAGFDGGKLQQIFSELTHIIAEHKPEVVAIEDVFYAINVKSALKLGQVRGVAMLAASSSGLEVAEYSPLSIKSAVVGYGRADKQQMQQMVMRLLNLPAPPQPADAADALGIAICHIHTATTLNVITVRNRRKLFHEVLSFCWRCCLVPLAQLSGAQNPQDTALQPPCPLSLLIHLEAGNAPGICHHHQV